MTLNTRIQVHPHIHTSPKRKYSCLRFPCSTWGDGSTAGLSVGQPVKFSQMSAFLFATAVVTAFGWTVKRGRYDVFGKRNNGVSTRLNKETERYTTDHYKMERCSRTGDTQQVQSVGRYIYVIERERERAIRLYRFSINKSHIKNKTDHTLTCEICLKIVRYTKQ